MPILQLNLIINNSYRTKREREKKPTKIVQITVNINTKIVQVFVITVVIAHAYYIIYFCARIYYTYNIVYIPSCQPIISPFDSFVYRFYFDSINQNSGIVCAIFIVFLVAAVFDDASFSLFYFVSVCSNYYNCCMTSTIL